MNDLIIIQKIHQPEQAESCLFKETVLKPRQGVNQIQLVTVSAQISTTPRDLEADTKPSLTIVRMFSVINCHHISVICHRRAHSEKITIKKQKQNSFFGCDDDIYVFGCTVIQILDILPICQCHWDPMIVVGSVPFLLNKVIIIIIIIIDHYITSRWSS